MIDHDLSISVLEYYTDAVHVNRLPVFDNVAHDIAPDLVMVGDFLRLRWNRMAYLYSHYKFKPAEPLKMAQV